MAIATGRGAAPSKRLYWQCLFESCGRNFTTTTRRGLRVTCPHCNRVQDGPAAIRARLRELDELKAKGRAERKSKGERQEHREPADATPAPAADQVDESAPHSNGNGEPRRGLLGKVLSGEWAA